VEVNNLRTKVRYGDRRDESTIVNR